MNEMIVSSDETRTERPPDQTQRLTSCPECEGSVCSDGEQGERVCEECGLVLDEIELDFGPEWRSFDDTDSNDQSRVGAPVTQLMHDKGLSTSIGWQDKDARGKQLSSRKRTKLRRLRRWNERYRAKDPQERNLKHALGEIQRMASALGLPKPCSETAGVIYRQAVKQELLPGRSIESMATASLYAAARQHSSPRTLAAFEAVSRVEKLPIQRAYRYLSQELGLEMKPADPAQYLGQIASELGLSGEAEHVARDILETAKEQEIHIGRNPAGIAAAAVYAAAGLTNEQVTQETVSEISNVSTVTIRTRYQEILEVYGKTRKSIDDA